MIVTPSGTPAAAVAVTSDWPDPEIIAKDLRILYQPIVRFDDGAPAAMEALSRLADPAGGLMPPGRFIAAIEAHGHDIALALALMRRAMLDWPGTRLAEAGLRLSLNLTVDVLQNPDALAAIEVIRAAANTPAERLVFELTETRPLVRDSAFMEGVAHLLAAGYGLALDDVGPGGRDDTCLFDLGFTALKLDRSVVQAAGEGRPAEAFMRNVIGLAHEAGMSVIAEGIETAAHWARLRALGADFGQGFLIGRPMAADSIAAWCQHWSAPAS